MGSVRSDRQGIRAVRYVEQSLAARGHELTVVDPVEVQLPLLDRMYKEYEKGTAPAVLERLALLYRAADAFIVVSGEYNHSIHVSPACGDHGRRCGGRAAILST